MKADAEVHCPQGVSGPLSVVSSPKAAKPKRKRLSPDRVRKISSKLWDLWRETINAAESGQWELRELATQLEAVYRLADNNHAAMALAEAERKDRRGGEVLWEVFTPDEILGTRIVRRTTHRIMEQRVPTFLDLAGIAFFGSKKDLDQYKPQWRAAHRYDDPWSGLNLALDHEGYRRKRGHEKLGERVAYVLEQHRKWMSKGGPDREKEAA